MSCVNILDNDTTLVSPPTFAQDFECQIRLATHNAGARVTLTFLPNGTWTLTHLAGSGSIVEQTGSWYIGVPPNPGLYEIRITGLRDTVDTRWPHVANPGEEPCLGSYANYGVPFDTGWVALSSSVAALAQASAMSNTFCNENMTESLAFTVTIRQASNHGNSVTGSGTLCAEADAQS